MNITANVKHWPHWSRKYDYRAGAEVCLQRILEHVAARGHRVSVLVSDRRPHWDCNGIRSLPRRFRRTEFESSSVLITTAHEFETRQSMRVSKQFNIPLIHLIHQEDVIECFELDDRADHYMFAAHWIERESRGRRNPNIPWSVCHPPVPRIVFNYQVPLEKRKYIGFVNPNPVKGSEMMELIARELPDMRFLVVVGAYGDQNRRLLELDNVTVVPHTQDIVADFYSQIRVLVCPSVEETWGMAATEAIMGGIPVVCTETNGLRENLSYAGIFIARQHRQTLGLWLAKIKSLMTDSALWYHHNELNRVRAYELSDEFQVMNAVSVIETVTYRG